MSKPRHVPADMPPAITEEDRYVYSDPAFIEAQRKSMRAMDARRRWPPGSTRARVTTANANWSNAAEARDRIKDRLRAEFQALKAKPSAPASRPTRAAVARAGQPVQIGRLVYTLELTGKPSFPYVLRGPRGGEIDTVRNIHSGVLYLMRGAKTLSGYATDEGGVFVYRP